MNRRTWMQQLDRALSREGMCNEDKRAVLHYYDEMYQDKRDDGMTEAEVLREFGFPEDVARSVRESDNRSRRYDAYEPRSRRRDRADDDYPDRRDEREDAELFDDEPPRRRRRAREDDGTDRSRREDRYMRDDEDFDRRVRRDRKPSRRKGRSAIATLLLLPLTLFLAFVGAVLLGALFVTSIALFLSGGIVAATSFVLIGQNFGAFLLGLGAGIVVFALGGLLIGLTVLCAKAWGKLLGWGFGAKGAARV